MSGGRGVPQFPGKPVMGGPAAEFAWERQMCPLLTAAEVQATVTANLACENAKVLGASGAVAKPPARAVEARRCQGPACAFFVPIGTKGDGGCAEMMKVTTMHSQNLLLEAIALKLGAIEREQTTQSPAQG